MVEINNLPLIHKAIAIVESNDDPTAIGELGERGRMQVLPSTAERPGFGVEPARDYSDLELTRVGQQYFNAMHGKYGNLNDALMAYNWGPGKTDKWIAAGRPPGIVPDGTKNYVQKVNQIVATQTGPEEDAVNVNQVVADPIQIDDSAEEIWKKYKEAHEVKYDPSKYGGKAAAFQTKTFQDSITDFNIPNPTKEDIINHAIKYGYHPDSYIEELNKYEQELKKGGDARADTTALGRFAGRVAGEVGEGLIDFGSVIYGDEFAVQASSLFKKAEDFLPPSYVRAIKEGFDPYHPDTTGGDIEYVAGYLGSLLVPTTTVIKGINIGNKVIRSLSKDSKILDNIADYMARKRGQLSRKDIEGGNFIMRGDELIRIPAMSRRSRKIDAAKRYTGTSLKYSTGFAAGSTIVETPEENFINILTQQFPETLEIFKGLAVDPDDSTRKKYLDAFLANMGLGIAMDITLAPAFLAKPFLTAGRPGAQRLAETAHKMNKSSLSNTETSLKELGEEASRPLEKLAAGSTLAEKWGVKKLLGWTTSRMGTNDDLLTSILRVEGAGPAAVTLANAMQRSLKKAARMDFGRSAYKTQEVVNKINEGLGGKKTILKDLETNQPNVHATLIEMRDQIDSLSKAISDNIGDSPLKFKIDKNYGAYLNRSYRAFDDPKWRGMDEFKDSKGQEIISKATAFLMKNGMDADDARVTIEWIASGMKTALTPDVTKTANPSKFIRTLADMGVGSGSKPLATKKNIPKRLRQLLGEVEDPYKNFSNTFEKLSIIKAEQDFLKEVIKNLKVHEAGKAGVSGKVGPEGWTNFKSDILQARLGRLTAPKGAWRRQPVKGGKEEVPRFSDEILKPFEEAVQKEFNLPLEKLFVDPVYAKAIKNGTEIVAPSSSLMKTWIRGKAFSQIAKTVASPATHARNIMGNNFIMLANGMLPFSLKGEATLFAKRLAGMNTREMAELIAEAQRLGVIDSGVKAGIVRGNLNDVAFNPTGRLNKILDKTGVLGKAVGSSGRKIFRLYQDEDNLYKFMHFNKTKDYLRKAYPGMANDDLLKAAAQRTRDLMPNYNLVSRSLKHLRRAPLGDFLSFPAEMTRVSKNLALYTLKDLKSGSPVLRREALKRLGGMISVGLGTDIISDYSKQVMGIDERQSNALNMVIDDYEKDVPKLFTSPVHRDDNGGISVNYVNFGPIDPFDYVKYAARAVINAITTDTEIDGADLSLRILRKQLDPFFGPSMILDAVTGISSTEFRFLDRDNDWKKLAEMAIKPFTPGFWPAVEKQRSYNRSLENLNRKELGLGAVGKYGQTLTADNADLFQNLAGVNIKNLDLTNQFQRAIKDSVKELGMARKTFTGSEAYRNLDLQDDEGLVSAYINSQEYKKKEMQNLRRKLNAFQYLTPDGVKLSYEDIYKSLTKDKRYPPRNLKIIEHAMENIFIPDSLTRDQIRYLKESFKGDVMSSPALEKIRQIQRQLLDTPIEEE